MSKKNHKITPPDSLYRVKVETSPMYPSYEKFWSLEVYSQERSEICGEITYRPTSYHGLAFTKFGLNRAIKKALKKANYGYKPKYIYL